MPRVRPAPAALALCLAVALAGCGSNGDRDALRAYIQKANAVQKDESSGLTAANAAYARLSQGKRTGPLGVSALEQTVDDLRATRDRLARITAPAQAETLRHRLLAVFDRSIALAREAAQLAVYVPSARRTMAALPRAGARLRLRLASATTPPVQTRALGRYADTLARLEGRMRRLDPPAVLLASHRSQLLRLDTARGLTGRLRAAIGRRDAQRVATLLLRFRSVYTATGLNVAVQRAAVGGYQHRVNAINTAIAAVQREQQRLERSLR